MTTVPDHPLFNHFGGAIEQTELLHEAKLTLWKKAKPSDGSGARYRNKEAGIEVLCILKASTISTIFLHGVAVPRQNKAYTQPLPGGITFAMSRAEVRKVLGQPASTLEKSGTGIFAITNAEDRWLTSAGHRMHVVYAPDDNSVTLVSITNAGVEF
jgi:hypothetical protein